MKTVNSTADIKEDRLYPDKARPFNAQECVLEGGIAVSLNGGRHRVLCIDRKHPTLRISTLYKDSNGEEQVKSYNEKGELNSQSSRAAHYRLYHPAEYDPDGFPVCFPRPHPVHGCTAIPRGFGWTNGGAHTKYSYSHPSSPSPARMDGWFDPSGGGIPQGRSKVFYVEYVPDFKPNGIPTRLLDPPKIAGMEWEYIGTAIDAEHTQLLASHQGGSSWFLYQHFRGKTASHLNGHKPAHFVKYSPKAEAEEEAKPLPDLPTKEILYNDLPLMSRIVLSNRWDSLIPRAVEREGGKYIAVLSDKVTGLAAIYTEPVFPDKQSALKAVEGLAKFCWDRKEKGLINESV